jgi:hypothetical protein
MRRTSRLKKSLSMNSTKRFTTRHCKISKKRISILMPKNASKSGRARARMLSPSYWNSKTTKRKLYEPTDIQT